MSTERALELQDRAACEFRFSQRIREIMDWEMSVGYRPRRVDIDAQERSTALYEAARQAYDDLQTEETS